MIEFKYILVAFFLKMAALPISLMLKAATEININFSGDYTIGTGSFKGKVSVKCYDKVAKMLDCDPMSKVHNF